tara:strand:+ start:821 stop:1279 length:459 start_codon:yes stop_codon:yes gene_type:complete
MPSKAKMEPQRLQRALERGVRDGMNKVALSLQKRIRKMLSKEGKGKLRWDGHAPSLPGDPPALDTGNLRNSWQAAAFRGPAKSGAEMKLTFGPRVGSAARYGWILEKGYPPNNLEPRPYIRPSIDMLRRGNRAQRIFNNQLRRAIAEANKQV